jgi:hypothetical protein
VAASSISHFPSDVQVSRSMGRKVLTHEHISSHPRWQLHTCVHLFWADAKRCCLVLLFCPPNKCVAQFSQHHAPDSRAVIRRNTEHQSASRFRVAASRNAPRTSGCIGISQDLHALPVQCVHPAKIIPHPRTGPMNEMTKSCARNRSETTQYAC